MFHSVSSDPSHRQDVFRMAEFLQNELKALGADNIETRDPGMQDFNGTQIPLPPIVLATVGTNPAKKTILVYGHYDVQPVSLHVYIYRVMMIFNMVLL